MSCERVSVRRLCEEEATEEENAEAAGAELKTKTPHNDVGKNIRAGINHMCSANSPRDLLVPVGSFCSLRSSKYGTTKVHMNTAMATNNKTWQCCSFQIWKFPQIKGIQMDSF